MCGDSPIKKEHMNMCCRLLPYGGLSREFRDDIHISRLILMQP